MAEEIQIYGPNARLMVTYDGRQGDYPDAVSFDMGEGDVKQVVAEALRTGYIPGVGVVPNPDLRDFVVARFEATQELPPRIVVRPKTPFGGTR